VNNDIEIGGNRKIGTDAYLDRYIKSFEERLKARNYTAGTIKTYRVLICFLGRIMAERGIKPEDLTVELAADLVQGEERKRREPHKYANIARRFAEHLIEIGVATAPPAGMAVFVLATLAHRCEVRHATGHFPQVNSSEIHPAALRISRRAFYPDDERPHATRDSWQQQCRGRLGSCDSMDIVSKRRGMVSL